MHAFMHSCIHSREHRRVSNKRYVPTNNVARRARCAIARCTRCHHSKMGCFPQVYFDVSCRFRLTPRTYPGRPGIVILVHAPRVALAVVGVRVVHFAGARLLVVIACDQLALVGARATATRLAVVRLDVREHARAALCFDLLEKNKKAILFCRFGEHMR